MKCSLVFHLSMMVSVQHYMCSPSLNALLLENTDVMYKYAVDYWLVWSKVLIFLCRKILEDPLLFGPEIGSEARSILASLLTRDPARRLGCNGAQDIKKHPFFGRHLDFKKLLAKEIQPPFKPSVASPVVSLRLMIPLIYAQHFCCRMFPTSTLFSRPRKPSIASWKTLNYRKLFRTNLLVCSIPA